MNIDNKELKLITYKKYKEYDKKILKKYKSKMSKKEYQYYTNENNIFGFMGNCIYANEKENKILDKLWTNHLEKISNYEPFDPIAFGCGGCLAHLLVFLFLYLTGKL